MKQFLLGFLLGLTCTAIAAYALPVLFQVQFIGHDAAGRTLHATAKGNSLNYNGAPTASATVLTLEYTSDQILCSGFGQ